MKLLARHKNQICAALCLLLCVGILLPCIALSDNTRSERESRIYNALVNALMAEDVTDNCQAIACGILGNILAETGGSPYNYNPITVGDYDSADVPTSGGLCGWHNVNWTNLNNWCKKNGYPWFEMDGRTRVVKRLVNGTETVLASFPNPRDTSAVLPNSLEAEMLEAQAHYIIYDLFHNVTMNFDQTRERILAVPNDIHGAWYVGYIFCCRYERPASMWTGGSITRGNNAQDFWQEYVDSDAAPITSGKPSKSKLAIDTSSLTLPDDRSSAYSSFIIKGNISSNYPIRSVAVYVKNTAGKTIISFARDDWDCYDFSIQWDGPDSTMKFAQVSDSGSYIYGVEATDVTGKTVSYQHVFYIGSATPCTYTFDADGGETVKGGKAAFGSYITLPATTRPGYTLTGWSDGTDTYDAGTKYRLMKTSVAFTARWAYTGPIPGDVTGDNKLTAADLTLLARHIAGIRLITDEDVLSRADVNEDGSISAADLTALAKLIK